MIWGKIQERISSSGVRSLFPAFSKQSIWGTCLQQRPQWSQSLQQTFVILGRCPLLQILYSCCTFIALPTTLGLFSQKRRVEFVQIHLFWANIGVYSLDWTSSADVNTREASGLAFTGVATFRNFLICFKNIGAWVKKDYQESFLSCIDLHGDFQCFIF